ncbi:ATP-dependent DNA helicase PIF1 [Tanacetum coccineum]
MVVSPTTYFRGGVPPAYHNLGPPSYQCSMCDATMWYAERTDKARRAAYLTFSLSCQEGKLRLPQFNDTPPLLKRLLDYTDLTTSKFREQIQMPAFMEKETFEKVDESTVVGLIQMLDRSNALVKSFRMAKEWCRSHHSQDFSLRLLSERTSSRHYNAPMMSEVAALIVNDLATQRLKWTQNNQDTLRVNLYHNLCDAITRGDTSAAGLEKRIVLPRSFIGSPRYMMQTYQDAMALFVYVIEFKKRGLPHVHILLWLEEHFKCTTPDEINDIISAELPSLVEDLDGYKVVSGFMLHGPYGKDAKYATCTTKGKCSKHYPKVFLAETVIDEDGYPIYHRRDNKVTAKKGKFTYNNQHVVPYNWYLLLKYQAHINVEWCNRSKAIKYLFKYLNRGMDKATIVIQEKVTAGVDGASVQIFQVDEIKTT